MASTPQITSTLNTTDWHVFLSFRGKDTRTGFTSHLHNALVNLNGIQTFMDNPDLRSGEIISSALVNAIQKSKIYIVVLSENYASSSWCLNELVEILKCSKEFGRLIIPVFYKIDSSVVRHQIGSFKAAFEKHEKVHFVGEDKLKEWRYTLSQVADISGHPVDQTRSEVDIINEVVDAVLREVNPMTIDVAKYPVGIVSRMAEITPLLTSGTQGIHYIGIWGMGGLGKTTLAKAVYNANFASFEGSCFLAIVTEVFSQPKGPEGLQAQLIADVLKVKKPEIDSIDKGKELIKQRISSKKVLIVVDDLNDQKQLDALVAGPFACGSVIILTTRKEDLLATVGVEATYRYMLKELSHDQSQELFNKHAFGDENPSDKFLVLSEEILRHAGGLPLALEIFGSNLRNQPEAQWRRFIGELKEVVNPNIQKNLVISFESLVSPALKEMFLDIACFFVGHLGEEVVPILESCYKDVDANIDHLKSRCLIKIDGNNVFSMHDLVRDMGWEIARRGYGKDELQEHSRIFGDDIYNVLDDINNDNKVIECMVDHHSHYSGGGGVSIDTDTIKRVPKLRFLKMKGVNLTGSFEQIFKNLRWLDWTDCPLETLPSDFCPKNLVILRLWDNKITRWNITKDLRNLKILDLSYSELITTPDFCRLPCLEKINLRDCSNLEKVDKTIGDLKNLVSLDLKGCTSMKRLPNLSNLKHLETLDLRNCSSLREIEGLEELTSMIDLRMKGCISIDTDTIKRVPKLRFLRMRGVNLTGSFEQIFKNLRWLHWADCPLETLPYDFCPKILVILELPCSKITKWNPTKDLTNLKILDLSYSSELITTPDFRRLPCLEKINLYWCWNLKKVDETIGDLKNLVSLNLMDCHSLCRLPDSVCKLTALETLDIGKSSLEALPDELGNMKSLTRLVVCSTQISKLPDSIGRLTKLVKLILYGNEKLETLGDTICNLRSLEILDITGCEKIELLRYDLSREIEGLGELTSMRDLQMSGCTSIERLPNLSNLKHLETLDLTDCSSLREIEGLEELTSIRYLNLRGCTSIERLPNLSNLKHLKRLELRDCSSLREIEGLEGLASMSYLQMYGCTSIERLPNLSNLKHLERLDLWNCSSLREIEGLEELTSMRELYMGGCTSIERLPNLSKLKHLETLYLKNCRSLREIEGLEELTSIRYLNLSGCTSIERLPNLSNLKHLDKLGLCNCSSLREIEGLEGLASITELDLAGCDSIMVERTLTEKLFQMYSEFGNRIEIEVDRGARPNWMSHSGTGGCTDVRTNNLLGLVLSIDCLGRKNCHKISTVIVSNNNKIFQSTWRFIGGPMMVIVPREELIELCGVYDDEDEDTPLSHFHLAQPLCNYCTQDTTTTARIHPLYKLPHESHGGSSSNKRKRAI